MACFLWKSKKHKYLSCNKDYANKFHEELPKWFKNTFKFSNDFNELVLLLAKGV